MFLPLLFPSLSLAQLYGGGDVEGGSGAGRGSNEGLVLRGSNASQSGGGGSKGAVSSPFDLDNIVVEDGGSDEEGGVRPLMKVSPQFTRQSITNTSPLPPVWISRARRTALGAELKAAEV